MDTAVPSARSTAREPDLTVRRQCGNLCSHARQEKSLSFSMPSSTAGSLMYVLPSFLSTGPKASKIWSGGIFPENAACRHPIG